MDDLKRLEAIAIEIITAETGIENLRISATQEVAEAPAGSRIFVFSAAPATDTNRPVGATALTERGKLVSLDSVIGKTLKPVFPDGTVIDVPPTDVDLPPVTISVSNPRIHLGACDTFVDRISVHIPATSAVPKADIYFLADTTGSMGGILSAVQSGASSILTSLSSMGLDLAYGVGNYKDFPYDPYAFQHQLNPTNIQANVQAQINAWSASGGSDGPEAALYALDQLVDNAPVVPVGWRSGSKRIVVWFGDVPSHDPICPAISGRPYTITEGSVRAKLVAAGDIVVLAISTNTPGLDGDPVPGSTDYGVCGTPGGSAGQATRIANDTGGQHVTGINASTIVTTIINLVQGAINTINSVTLVPTGGIIPYVTSISPASYGPLNGSVDNTLTFTVTYSSGPCGDRPQIVSGGFDVVIDGIVRAQAPVTITQDACGYVYSVKYLCGVQDVDSAKECAPVRPGIYATEINIHNPLCSEATLDMNLTPLVLSGDAIGRYPSVSEPRVSLRPVTLPPHGATMVDCCIMLKYLDQDPSNPRMNIGFLEIRSQEQLAITAVYTVTDMDGRCIDLEVVPQQPLKG